MTFLSIEIHKPKKDPTRIVWQLFWLVVPLLLFFAWMI